MFIEKIKSPGLAHLSYVLGDGTEAAVIDPRRDTDIYLSIAHQYSVRITHILETHLHEDFVSGAARLANITRAKVLHGPNPAGKVQYADEALEGDHFSLGKLSIRVLETPGHTDDSLSYVFYENEAMPMGVFTGDTLLIEEVGRTDFYPDRAEEVAGKLYDSLHKLLTLGDQTILYPAHGAGSVCGSGMADRDFSTLGQERQNNKKLQIKNRDEFVNHKIEEQHYYPPYFRLMEKLNQQGVLDSFNPLSLKPLQPGQLEEYYEQKENVQIVDIRSPEAFAGAHLPNSLNLPVTLISSYGGWLLNPEDHFVLIADDLNQAKEAMRLFSRIGYKEILGVYVEELSGWAASGRKFKSINNISVKTVQQRISERKQNWQLLDVRKREELEKNCLEQARHIYLGHLPGNIDQLDKNVHYTVFCGSGKRATVGASVLCRAGFPHVDIFFGSMGAWENHQDSAPNSAW